MTSLTRIAYGSRVRRHGRSRAAPANQSSSASCIQRMRDHGRCMRPARLRFAPSPTGPLHLGSAVVAVANALGARSLGGELLLRIDDTDAARTVEGAEQGILDDLAWLGLELTGAPVRQSERRELHLAAARELLATAHAYRCFCPPSQERYDGRCRALPRGESERRHEAGEPNVVRFRVPGRRGRRRGRDARAGALRGRRDLRLRARARRRTADVRSRDLRRRPRPRDHAHRARRGSPRELGAPSAAAARAGRGRAGLRALPDHRRRRRRAALDARAAPSRSRRCAPAACRPRPSSRTRRSSPARRREAPARSRRSTSSPGASRSRASAAARRTPIPRISRGSGARCSRACRSTSSRGGWRRSCRRTRRSPSCTRSQRRRAAPRRSARSQTLLRSWHSDPPDPPPAAPALELFCELREADAREHLPYAAAVELVDRLRALGTSRGLSARDVLHPLRIALTGAPHGLPLPVVVAVLPREEALERCRT